MNFQSNRYQFEFARPEDGAEMLEILEESDFKGQISLIYTRRPDAYASLMAEGEAAAVVICRDTEKNKVVGFGACSIHRLYINGKATSVGYLSGLRVRKEYRRLYPFLPRGYSLLRSFCTEHGVEYCFTSILEENHYARRLLEKKRGFMPDYIPLSVYETFIIKTGTGKKAGKGYRLIRAKPEDMPSMIEFLNLQGKSSQFFPAIAGSDFENKGFSGLNPEDFYILRDQNDEIAACAAAWDQSSYKQYILGGYSGLLKIIYPISSLIKLFGYPSLPKPGKILEFFTLSFLTVRDNNENIFNTFISLVSREQKKYPFFIIGMGEANLLKKAVEAIPHISYKSRVYLVDWDKTGGLEIDNKFPINPECGLL
ncbi:MAG: GNAT family N-acetyltransferase [Ruminiclostridium sp.]|nr:GNAT family N-acetyltransferase [Ruminiclostridium sp.]